MKKAVLTIGLFTLVLASTSFAAPTTSTSSNADNAVITSIDGNGGQDSGGGKKLDYNNVISKDKNTKRVTDIDGNGGQDSGGGKKLD